MVSTRQLVIGTRGSQLALWQARWVANRLSDLHPGLQCRISVLKTSGDRFPDVALSGFAGPGAFTKEIQEALCQGHIDVAVHSLKDLPTEGVPGLRVWAYPLRFDPRDVWFGRDGIHYADLPSGAVIATGALRRAAQAKHRHPTAFIVPLRGNIDTRLQKFRDGNMTGMFLANAGLARLGYESQATEVLSPEVFLPAPGQGALAVEGRDDPQLGEILTPLNHEETVVQVTAERAFLTRLQGGCQVPVGALARFVGKELLLDGLLTDPGGVALVRQVVRGSRADAQHLGELLADQLLAAGGREILRRLRLASS